MPSGHPLTAEQKQQILALDKKNYFPLVIARMVGVKKQSVVNYLKKVRLQNNTF